MQCRRSPNAVPVVIDEATAALSPELAVLSAIVHGRGPHAEAIGRAAVAAAPRLDEERAALYIDVIFASVHAVARTVIEGLMANGTYEYQSDFALRYVAKGREEGRQEGRQEGRASAVLAVLDARGVEVPVEARARVLACTDVATLDTWLARAANALTVGDVLGD